MNKKNAFFTIILLIIFSGISAQALFSAKKITKISSIDPDVPDFFMTNAMYMQFDHNGKINNQFHTNQITHFPINNNYIFDNPQIKIYNNCEQPWNITANKGRSEGGKSKIYLWDNVKIIQASNPDNPDFDITTTDLTVYPDIKFAETKKPITIIQSGSIAKAIGAEADFKNGTVKLLSNVEGQYQAK